MGYLEFKGVSKIFKRGSARAVRAVDGIDLEVERGELLVILGPSGCGKTTLLRLTVGLEDLTRGDIRLDGKSIIGVPPDRRPFALVFQNYALYPHLTAAENMTLGPRMRGVDKKRIRARLEETMEMLRLGWDELRRKPAELSGGQRQRVALGKAIMLKPEVFLLDEPMSNLDQKLRIHLRQELRRIQGTLKATMLLVTHDQAEAASLGDRVALLDGGRLAQVGRPMELYESPRNLFVARFMANPAMNLVRGVLMETRHGPVFREIGQGTIRLRLDQIWNGPLGRYLGREVIMGVMPEFVGLARSATGQGWAKVVHLEVCAPIAYLYLETGAHRICGLTRPATDLAARERVGLSFDLRRVIFFDVSSGARIGMAVA